MTKAQRDILRKKRVLEHAERIGNIRRFQYTAIDDATRIRALKVYRRHTQQNAILCLPRTWSAAESLRISGIWVKLIGR